MVLHSALDFSLPYASHSMPGNIPEVIERAMGPSVKELTVFGNYLTVRFLEAYCSLLRSTAFTQKPLNGKTMT